MKKNGKADASAEPEDKSIALALSANSICMNEAKMQIGHLVSRIRADADVF